MLALTELINRIASGRHGLPEALCARQASYLLGLQQPDGGFPNRCGGSDPYYTAFGLGALALLGRLDEQVSAGASAFLLQRLRQPLLPVEFIAAATGTLLLHASSSGDALAATLADLQQQAASVLDPLRLPDGGYAKTARSSASSTYQTFLAISCKQLLGMAQDDLRLVAAFLRSRQRPDGGFAEVHHASTSGVNPTAAAVVLARIIQAQAEASETEILLPSLRSAARYLAAMQTPEGGLRASALVPLADLLSTFTGLVALVCLGADERIDRAAMRRYVAGLEHPSGGFCGSLPDRQPDCEYTFYALGTLALLCSAG
jgi:prenyltransferase beta subunit